MAYGLRPVHPTRIRKYYVPATDSTALYIGDCVIKVGDANDNEVRTGSGTYEPGALSEVTRATNGDGNKITGVIVGIDVMPDDNARAAYRKASTEAVISVADDPSALFEIEADGALAADSVGLNAVLINTGGSTATGLSDVALDTTSDAPAADASNQLLIVALKPEPGNALTDSAPEVIVMINQHTENQGTVGALGIA